MIVSDWRYRQPMPTVSKLVLLPFDPSELGVVPEGLAIHVFDATDALPAAATDAEFYVPAYRFDPRVVEVIPSLSRLQVIQTLTAGVEHIRPHVAPGVTLCNARGVHDASTSELAVALMLAALRGIPDFVRAQARASWAPDIYPALADKTVLILGYGSIGAAVEQRLAGFECDIVKVARTPRDEVAGIDQLPALLPQADVVVLTVPITDETRGLVDRAFLAAMKSGALLVNVSRGQVVDTEALLTELLTGRLRAALDVTDPEPLPADHLLWQAPGVLISPHVGGDTSAFWPRAHALVREQLARYAAGEPLANVVADAY